jgi:hypothetical protein
MFKELREDRASLLRRMGDGITSPRLPCQEHSRSDSQQPLNLNASEPLSAVVPSTDADRHSSQVAGHRRTEERSRLDPAGRREDVAKTHGDIRADDTTAGDTQARNQCHDAAPNWSTARGARTETVLEPPLPRRRTPGQMQALSETLFPRNL